MAHRSVSRACASPLASKEDKSFGCQRTRTAVEIITARQDIPTSDQCLQRHPMSAGAVVFDPISISPSPPQRRGPRPIRTVAYPHCADRGEVDTPCADSLLRETRRHTQLPLQLVPRQSGCKDVSFARRAKPVTRPSSYHSSAIPRPERAGPDYQPPLKRQSDRVARISAITQPMAVTRRPIRSTTHVFDTRICVLTRLPGTEWRRDSGVPAAMQDDRIVNPVRRGAARRT